MSITKQNSFSRVLANEAKMGAYYTDLQHCQWISNLLDFPIDKEVCALEPSIGDGSAIKTVSNCFDNPNIKIFGVELNKETDQLLQEDKEIEKSINADFLNGVKITNSAFSFCFSNPPYGEQEGERLEKRFLEKIGHYLKPSAILVYVIPYSVFINESFLKIWCARYELLHIYKFHEEEFNKWKQVVLIGRKKIALGYLRKELDDMVEKYSSINNLEGIPESYDGPKVVVRSSYVDDIEYFSTLDFQYDKVMSAIKSSPLHVFASKKLEKDEYLKSELTNPPLPMKRDLMYLLSVSGGGEGKAGNEENQDVHLQRGVVKVVETDRVDSLDEKSYLRVRSSSSITVTIIENDGKITKLT